MYVHTAMCVCVCVCVCACVCVCVCVSTLLFTALNLSTRAQYTFFCSKLQSHYTPNKNCRSNQLMLLESDTRY